MDVLKNFAVILLLFVTLIVLVSIVLYMNNAIFLDGFRESLIKEKCGEYNTSTGIFQIHNLIKDTQ